MHEKILVIDDEPLVLLSIERALLKVGYEVVATSDMKDFLDAVASRKFDMIIMGLHMAGIRTNELAEEARRHIPSVKFMTISGSVRSGFKIFSAETIQDRCPAREGERNT